MANYPKRVAIFTTNFGNLLQFAICGGLIWGLHTMTDVVGQID